MKNDVLDSINQILTETEGATAGPWAYELDSICHGYEFRDGKHVATWIATVDHENREDYTDDGHHCHSPQAARDAALMAAAPDMRALLERIGTLLGQLHPLAVTASSSTGTAAQVRAARDELVRVCLELGGPQ